MLPEWWTEHFAIGFVEALGAASAAGVLFVAARFFTSSRLLDRATDIVIYTQVVLSGILAVYAVLATDLTLDDRVRQFMLVGVFPLMCGGMHLMSVSVAKISWHWIYGPLLRLNRVVGACSLLAMWLLAVVRLPREFFKNWQSLNFVWAFLEVNSVAVLPLGIFALLSFVVIAVVTASGRSAIQE